MGRPVYHLRNLQAFLKVSEKMNHEALDIAGGLIFSVTAAAVGASILSTSVAFLGVGALVFAAATLVSTIRIVVVARKRPKENILSMEAFEALYEIQSYDRDGSLEDRLDSEIGRELDSCCALVMKIRQTLGSSAWSNVAGAKLLAKDAAQSALGALTGDMLVASLAGVRQRGSRRDTFARRMSNPETKGQILGTLRAIHFELRRLDTELTGATSPFELHEQPIRTAIERLSELRIAEEELRQSNEA